VLHFTVEWARTDPGYDGTLRFHQTRYTLTAALEVLGNPQLQAPLGIADIYRAMTACEIFVGNLLFDTLVGNTDRHHENWGVVDVGTFTFHLAPSFDHASSLGRDLTDQNRRERLNTSDRRASVKAYAERGRSAFFGTNPKGRTLTGREMVESLVQVAPRPARIWAEKLVNLDQSSLERIFEQVPREVMSENAVQFAIRLIADNQRMIWEAALAR
jgi:hypothetical protein